VVVGLVGVPALVRWFSAFTGDEAVLEDGTPGTATITSLHATRWRFNRQYPIVRFGLTVEAGGRYPVDVTQAVDPEMLTRLGPGAVVGVRIDRSNHKKVVIDWRQPVQDAPGAVLMPATRTPLRPLLRWIFLVFGLVFVRLSWEEAHYEAGGTTVQGVVLEKTYSPGTSATSSSPSSPARHYISYRFTTKEGRTLDGRYDVLPTTWRALERGGAVVVEYLPSAPQTNRVPAQRAASLTWAVMAGVLLTASAVLFVVGWRKGAAHTP
jgi:hypothetical protein